MKAFIGSLPGHLVLRLNVGNVGRLPEGIRGARPRAVSVGTKAKVQNRLAFGPTEREHNVSFERLLAQMAVVGYSLYDVIYTEIANAHGTRHLGEFFFARNIEVDEGSKPLMTKMLRGLEKTLGDNTWGAEIAESDWLHDGAVEGKVFWANLIAPEPLYDFPSTGGPATRRTVWEKKADGKFAYPKRRVPMVAARAIEIVDGALVVTGQEVLAEQPA